MSRRTSTRAVINLFDTTAKQDGAYVVNDILSFCDIQRLDENEIETVKFGTLEDGGFLLDGSCQIMDETVQVEDFGYWSAEMSNEAGSFSINPKIERQFIENHSAAGLTLHFDKQYPLPKQVCVTFKNSIGELLGSEVFNVDRHSYFCNLKVDEFRYMSLEFLQTESYQYARLNGIDYGRKLEYSQDAEKNLSKATLLEELNITSSEVSVNTSSVTVIDPDETFNIDNPQGYYTLLQQRQKMDLYETIDGVEYQMATHYIKTWETTSGVISTFSCQDILGVMDGTNFKGSIYDAVPAGEIIDEIMTSFGWTDYYVDREIAELLLSGIIKPCSHRAALQQVLFACCGVIDTSRITGINMYRASHTTQTIILADRKFMSPAHSIKQMDLITDVEVTAHKYIKGSELKDAYKAALDPGIYEVSLKSPFADYTAINCTILESDYFRLKLQLTAAAEVKVQGHPYEDSATIYRKSMEDLPAGSFRNSKQVTDATLVSASNAVQVAEHLYEYYQYRLSHEMKIICEDEKVGNFAAVKTKQNMVAVVLGSMSLDLTGGFLASCKGIGYALKIGDYDYAGNELKAGDEIGVM